MILQISKDTMKTNTLSFKLDRFNKTFCLFFKQNNVDI